LSYDTYSYLVLCEDKRQYYFVQSYLCNKGVNSRKIRSAGLPAGDAKQFVEKNYQEALSNIRKNERDILIVVRDADKEDYDDVIKNFGSSNSFVIVPKRHIETWYYYLDNPESTESTDEGCKRKDQYPKGGVKPTKYGKKLEPIINEIRQNKKPSNMPVSLFRTITHLVKCENSKRLVED
jgi:hypothetical protein